MPIPDRRPGCNFKLSDLAQVHKLCQASASQILNDFKPNLMIAIGGGGYVPARILRYTIIPIDRNPPFLHSHISDPSSNAPTAPTSLSKLLGSHFMRP